MVAALAPATERCPACHQERPHTELWRKGKRLVCCHSCYWERRHAGRARWEEANRARRTRQRRQGGVPCPVYEAWTVWMLGPGVCAVAVDVAEPDAVVLPGHGACSCGEAGCVHLMVALLAQQGGERDG